MLTHAFRFVLLLLVTLPVFGETWYVRADGGTRYSARTLTGQCDGQADAAYKHSGVNQHCAFNDFRFLYDDQAYGKHTWVIAGGDTVIVDNSHPWRIGFDQGVTPNDKWCLGDGGPFSCFNPTVPSGTPAAHTKILGRNHGACGTGTAADPARMTQLFGGFGVGTVLSMSGAQYVDLECMEITRHSQCVRHGDPMYPAGCSSSFPLDDYDSEGITTDVNTHDLYLKDVWIHGHTDRGIIGPIGGLVSALRVTIGENGMAGWDFDDGKGTPLRNATWNFSYSTIEWNGCNQEYPAKHKNAVISCYGQGNGGYGDGVGTPTGTGMNVTVDHSVFRYNTQDGLDLGHIDHGGPYTLSITDSLFYGNNGGAVKWGANFTRASVLDNLILANCHRLAAPMDGTPATYNAHLGDFCRAQDAVSFNFIHGGSLLMANNTIVSYAPTTLDISCWDKNCGNSVFTFKNNVVLGYDNPALRNSGGQEGGPGGFYYQSKIGSVIRSNNVYFGLRNLTCEPTERCVSPRLVGQPRFTREQDLDNFNFHLASDSPALNLGVNLGEVSSDFDGTARPANRKPDAGAYQH